MEDRKPSILKEREYDPLKSVDFQNMGNGLNFSRMQGYEEQLSMVKENRFPCHQNTLNKTILKLSPIVEEKR